nr:hypothetical protein Iba_chr01dCG6820 [Ipomoea batatas]
MWLHLRSHLEKIPHSHLQLMNRKRNAGSYDQAQKKSCHSFEGLTEHICIVDNFQ